jgi:enoyl-CoA hydratase
MELILTGRTMPRRKRGRRPRHEGRPGRSTLDEALDLAARIAAQPPLAVRAAKQAILRAHELSLSAGLDFERRAFFLLFASDDQTEGMAAFSEKRPPRWTGR